MHSIARVGTFFLDTILPVQCLRCHGELLSENDYLCQACNISDECSSSSFLCPICDARLPQGSICKGCRRKTKLNRFFCATQYANPYVRSLIHQYKYGGARIYAAQITLFLTNILKQHKIPELLQMWDKPAVITPVPLTKQRLRLRTFNQSELIAESIAEICNISVLKDVLVRTRQEIPQAEIENEEQRKENVKNSFRCADSQKLQKATVILVDDVYTSGATMEECARVLKQAGAKEVWGMVIAKG